MCIVLCVRTLGDIGRDTTKWKARVPVATIYIVKATTGPRAFDLQSTQLGCKKVTRRDKSPGDERRYAPGVLYETV